MLLIQKFDGILIGCKENSFSSEGKEQKYFNVSVEVNDETAMFSCAKDVAEKIQSGQFAKYSMQTFVTEFNTSAEPSKRKIRVVDIVVLSPTKK